MKRQAMGNLVMPRAKKPAIQSSNTLHAYFSPRQTQTGDSVNRTPVADVEEYAGSVDEVSTDKKSVALSDEQQRVLRMVVRDEKNIFFTGSAGTGKSLLLREIIEALKKKYAKNPESLAICASTGMAAQNIGGTTIHAWGAVTPGVFDIDKQITFIKHSRPAHRRWKAAKVFIIDEVSMVDGQFFDLLAALAVALRKKKTRRPFGGIQVILRPLSRRYPMPTCPSSI